nr:universal stress protein PHOS32-like [Malus domestica]
MAAEKQVMVIGADQSEQSQYALEWTLDHFFKPFGGDKAPFKLIIVHAKVQVSATVGLAGPGKNLTATWLQVTDVVVEVVEGDARNVLCDAVERHHASILVVGSHGYGAIKRAVLGSVSDYCAHHAHSTVMIVKKPKTKH